jgi:arsenate reductase
VPHCGGSHFWIIISIESQEKHFRSQTHQRYPMKKIYYLGTCSTCIRIIKELGLDIEKMEFQDIKTEKMTPAQVEQMKEMSGSYESLFSRRAMKYKSMGLADKDLTENDYRDLIVEEYTFLKRPVIILDDQIFVGNSKNVVNAAKAAL